MKWRSNPQALKGPATRHRMVLFLLLLSIAGHVARWYFRAAAVAPLSSFGTHHTPGRHVVLTPHHTHTTPTPVVNDGSAAARERFYLPLRRTQLMVVLETEVWRRGFPNITYGGYDGPWLEDAYYAHWKLRGPPIRSERTYLPIYWTACHHFCTLDEVRVLNAYVAGLDRAQSYYTVITLDHAFQHPALGVEIPADLDLLVFTAGSCAVGGRVKNIVVPLLKDIPTSSLVSGMGGAVVQKVREVNFVGSLDTHPVRMELDDMYGHLWLIARHVPDWVEIMQQSHFTLCPRGYGHTSYRLAEAIHMDSIPIYVWDEELLLPYRDEMPWEDMAIVAHRSEISSLGERVRAFDKDKAGRLWAKWKPRFTMAGVVAQIHEMAAAGQDVVDECREYRRDV